MFSTTGAGKESGTQTSTGYLPGITSADGACKTPFSEAQQQHKYLFCYDCTH